MPADLFQRCDLDLIYPPFLERALEVIARCRARGQDYWATYGYRSWGEQHQLRMLYLAGKGGKAAPAGYSAHNYGLAFDFCPDASTNPGLQPDWTDKRYAILGEETPKAGLIWGVAFGDKPHVQWPGFVAAASLEPLRKIYAAHPELVKLKRLRKVWDYLDSHSSPLPAY